MHRFLAILAFLISELAITHFGVASSTPQRYEFSRLEMGTLFRVVLFAGSVESAETASYAALDRVQELNRILSDYQEDSELNQVCRTAYEGPRVVSPELFFVLQKSLEMSRRTQGSFDISIRPLVKLWREAGEKGKLPESQEIQEALSHTGYQKILLNPMTRAVRLREPQMELDLGGIAKGYALDEAMRVLNEHGISMAMVDGGGDLRIGEPPPGSKGWKVEVPGRVVGSTETLHLSNVALASSGDLYRHYEFEGVRYSHIVDPSTGFGLKQSPKITVLASEGVEADALATALSVMSATEAINFVEQLPATEARLILAADHGIVVCSSSGFPP